MDKTNNNERSKSLGTEPVINLLMKHSIPAMVGMLVNALYNIVDRVFIGRAVGGVAIGGIYLGMPLMLIIMAFGMLVGIGGNTLVSIRLGQKRKDEADQIASNSLMLLIIIGIIFSILGLIFLKPLLNLFGASASNIGYAMDYLRIILLGATFNVVGFGMNNFIRGEGNPKIAMFTMLIGAFLNVILDYVFIIIFKMGVQGAALATIISQIVSATWVLHYFYSEKSVLKIQKRYLKIKMSIFKEIVSNGLAPFSMQLATSMVAALYNTNLQALGGDLATSSMGVINSLSMVILMPAYGINQGSQPIMGYNYGASKQDRVKKTLKYATLGATLITTLGFLIVQIFPNQIITLFVGQDGSKELLNIAVPGIRILLSMLPFVGIQIVSTSYFQAIGRPKEATLLSMSRQVLILIPALLILPNIFGLTGVWMSGALADLLSSAISVILIINSVKNLK